MEINAQKRFFSERDALTRLLEETSRAVSQMDMVLVRECLYFLYPENEEEDRAYIERTLPILHEKLGFVPAARAARRSRPRMALVAVFIVLGVVMLASVVAYAFGINILNFFIYGTDEYWMIHVNTPEAVETVAPDLPAQSGNYEVWGEAVVQSIEEMHVFPALPKLIPEGYAYVSITDTGFEEFFLETTYHYAHPDGRCFDLILRIMDYSLLEAGSHVQKEEFNERTVFRNGIEIALANNYDSVSATWISGNCRVSIIGIFTMDELEDMINSI